MFTNMVGALFFSLAPILLLARFLWAKPPWWGIGLAVVFGGWAAYFLMVVSYFDDLQQLVDSLENPDQELVDRAFADGGPLIGAAMGGWLISIVYALPWWGAYVVATWIRRLAGRGRSRP